jgi:flagella basal body P-ring formation protein FlgA
MRGRRLIAILVGVVGLVLLAVVLINLLQGGDEPEAATASPSPQTGTPAVAEGTPAPTTTPMPTVDRGTELVEVVVSLQTVPRGWQMTEAELAVDTRLASEVASNALVKLEDAIGLYARNDIYQGETLTTDRH